MSKPFVLITGATAGFGKACAELFAREGYALVITGRRNDRLLELAEEIKSTNSVEVVTSCFDVRDEKAVNNAISALPDSVRSKLSILINNAGLAVGKGPIDEGLTDDWNRMIDTNVKGLLYVSRAVIPLLKEFDGHRQIINIGSIAGKEVYPGGNVYCASKHAVDALSKAMRIDLLPHNIKVSNIAPGAAETEFSLVRFKGNQEIADSTYLGFSPLVAQDIAETALFLATRPAHVNINDIVIMPTAQASATVLKKD
ncbi:MAG: SDR family NAD(P)-dependent oxidoreductase [Crocinitomicaceae bacterium]|nr:SDR family NAD(P)-dependent oxidoreductase [Flavobacteriales bacterium]NQZ36525.1 SDR family NAD(P)-dependent oxidoreductase [Crocinitomicaceae bacterium]